MHESSRADSGRQHGQRTAVQLQPLARGHQPGNVRSACTATGAFFIHCHESTALSVHFNACQHCHAKHFKTSTAATALGLYVYIHIPVYPMSPFHCFHGTFTPPRFTRQSNFPLDFGSSAWLCFPCSTRQEEHFEFLSQSFHSKSITGVSVCMRKPLVATSSLDHSVRIWNYETK